MTSWMRARPIPMFFLVNLTIALAASLAGIATDVLSFHDHVVTSAALYAIVFSLLLSAMVTIREWFRRRLVSTPQ